MRSQSQSLSRAPGQLMIIGFDGIEMSPRLSKLLARVQPAGVILFARNIRSADQTWRLLRDCRSCVATPLFACVDLEGGNVDRFRDVLTPAPAAADVFSTHDRALFRKHGELIGANCRALGFNVNFAPVLDLAGDASRKVLGSRAVSANPRETAAYAREFLAGLSKVGVLGCGKHFPGLGEGRLDSHHELPVIEKSLRQLWAEDLLPYRMLRGQLPFAMISHAAYPLVTRDRTPASLSKLWINDILRKRIGYHNLIVSDDLEMGGVLAAASIGEAAVEFIRAGGDLCLVCHRQDRIFEVHEALANAVDHDEKFKRRVAESGRRVAAFKKRRVQLLRPSRSAKGPSAKSIDKLSRRLWEFSEQVRLESLSRHTGRPVHE